MQTLPLCSAIIIYNTLDYPVYVSNSTSGLAAAHSIRWLTSSTKRSVFVAGPVNLASKIVTYKVIMGTTLDSARRSKALCDWFFEVLLVHVST